jgi:hypothetical protein
MLKLSVYASGHEYVAIPTIGKAEKVSIRFMDLHVPDMLL